MGSFKVFSLYKKFHKYFSIMLALKVNLLHNYNLNIEFPKKISIFSISNHEKYDKWFCHDLKEPSKIPINKNLKSILSITGGRGK
jgi:hypothetical protein